MQDLTETNGVENNKNSNEDDIEPAAKESNGDQNGDLANDEIASNAVVASESNEQDVSKFEACNDMFDDEFDVQNTVQTTTILKNAHRAENDDSHLNDNFDDADGYYKIVVGDVLKDRYLVKSLLGQGVFSNVALCHVLSGDREGQEVAVKIIRNNDLMYNQGMKELGYVKMLSEADPDSKCHVINLYGHFMFRSHLCIVFPCMSQNLRGLLNEYGKNVGLSIHAVRLYAKQLFTALKLLMKCGIIHADIKPDNILVTSNNTQLKLADFGSVVKSHEIDYTPYLVSRFYRAPEIIIGHPFDFGADLWSVAVTLYELFTSHVMFPGANNNQMILKFCELNGKVPNRMIRRSLFRAKHFDDAGNFILHEVDAITQLPKETIVHDIQAKRDLHAELRKYAAHSLSQSSSAHSSSTKHSPSFQKSPAYVSNLIPKNNSSPSHATASAMPAAKQPKFTHGSRGHTERKIAQFKDLLENLLMIDPSKRMNLVSASTHEFVMTE